MNHFIIKGTTLVLFTTLLAGFIALKSGCITTNSTEGAEEKPYDEEEINISFDSNKKIPTDTVAIQGSDDFAIVDKLMISSSKSMMVLEAEEIISIISGDSLPKDFKPTSDDTITAKGYNMYLEMQKEEKEKIDVTIPSSKSAPIFKDND